MSITLETPVQQSHDIVADQARIPVPEGVDSAATLLRTMYGVYGEAGDDNPQIQHVEELLSETYRKRVAASMPATPAIQTPEAIIDVRDNTGATVKREAVPVAAELPTEDDDAVAVSPADLFDDDEDDEVDIAALLAAPADPQPQLALETGQDRARAAQQRQYIRANLIEENGHNTEPGLTVEDASLVIAAVGRQLRHTDDQPSRRELKQLGKVLRDSVAATIEARAGEKPVLGHLPALVRHVGAVAAVAVITRLHA